MIITEEAYELILKYARFSARSINDIEDIAQEAVLLLLKNPAEGILPNNFYRQLVKRGAYHFYIDTYHKKLINQDVLLNNEDFDLISENIVDLVDIEDNLALKELKTKLYNVPVKNKSHFVMGIGKKESELLHKILNGYETQYSDRGHFNNLKINLINYFN